MNKAIMSVSMMMTAVIIVLMYSNGFQTQAKIIAWGLLSILGITAFIYRGMKYDYENNEE